MYNVYILNICQNIFFEEVTCFKIEDIHKGVISCLVMHILCFSDFGTVVDLRINTKSGSGKVPVSDLCTLIVHAL